MMASIIYDKSGSSILLDDHGNVVDKAELAEISYHNEMVPTLFMKEDQRKKFKEFLEQCQAAYFQTPRINRGRVISKGAPPRILTEEVLRAMKGVPMPDTSVIDEIVNASVHRAFSNQSSVLIFFRECDQAYHGWQYLQRVRICRSYTCFLTPCIDETGNIGAQFQSPPHGGQFPTQPIQPVTGQFQSPPHGGLYQAPPIQPAGGQFQAPSIQPAMGQFQPQPVQSTGDDLISKLAEAMKEQFDPKPKEQAYMYRRPYLEWMDQVALPNW